MESRLFILGIVLALSRIASTLPAATSMNNNPIQSNVLTTESDHGVSQKTQAAPAEQPLGQLVYRSAAPLQSNNQPTYVSGYSQPVAYPRDALSGTGTPPTAPFFGLSSNGDFQLSAYFSQIFWIFTAVVIGVALLIYVIRVFFPSESLGGIVDKIKESSSARSLDLDRLTGYVYRAIEAYEKYSGKDSKAFNASRPETRKSR